MNTKAFRILTVRFGEIASITEEAFGNLLRIVFRGTYKARGETYKQMNDEDYESVTVLIRPIMNV